MRFFISKTFSIFFYCYFIFFDFNLSAQPIPDSFPIGIINVKRPPIPASYRTSIVYFNIENSQNQKRITEFSAKQIVFGDSGSTSIAPQPSGEDFAYEIASHFGMDSISKPILPLVSSDATTQFDWEKYLKLISWQFVWSDSTKSDSAQFEFTIDKKGRAKCKALPWNKADSTCRSFEKKSLPYLFLLNSWYPAKKSNAGLFRRKGKFKNIPCIVIVTIYAYDPNAGKLLPIEKVIAPK